MALPEKLTYGSYEVLQNTDGSPCILGQGSFGVTYKARHGFLGRITALKVIREDLLNRGAKEDHEETNRFLDEARAVSKLNHPGIAMVHDCALDKGIFYYAMEYCDGGTLQDWCELWGAMPWSEVRLIAFQIASALEYAHATGFLHRDIKPANIMLNGQGKSRQAKLIDFGLAKKFGTDIESSSATVRNDQENFRGNFATASPEQILEKPLDRRSDLFSFGVTLWWLLIGRNPFGQMKRGPLIAERVGPLSYSSLLPEDLDPEARTLLEELLEKDSKKRISSAHEVVARLGFSATPVSVKPDIASPTPLEPLPEPADFEGGYSTPPHLFATAGQAKLYLSNNLVTGQPIIAVTNESLDPVVLGGMRIAASRKLDFGVYAFLDWRLSGGEDTFVISKPEGCSLLAVLRKFGPARFLDALPLLSHLARCFDASQAWTSFGIQVDPGEILVRARDGGANPDQFRSWSDVDPQGSRCLPLFTSDADQSASSEATLSTSAVEFPPLAQFAALVYRVLAGSAVRYAAFHTSSGYLMASGLSEDGNALLADTISAPEIQPSACRFLQLLASLESLPIAELTPLLEPPSLEELEIGKLVPIPSKPAISGDIHGPTLSDTTPNQLDNSTSVTDKVADLERQLLLAKRAAQEEAQRQVDEWAREEAEEEQRLEEESRIAAEETKRKEEEVARQVAEDQRRADDLARQISEAERAAAFETRRREDEAQRRSEENRIRREADIKKRALELDRLEAEANRAVEEARKSDEEAKRNAEDDRIRKETEAIKRAQELDRQAADVKRAVEEARRKDREAAEAKALQDVEAKKHAIALARQAVEAKAKAAREETLREEEARRKTEEEMALQDAATTRHTAEFSATPIQRVLDEATRKAVANQPPALPPLTAKRADFALASSQSAADLLPLERNQKAANRNRKPFVISALTAVFAAATISIVLHKGGLDKKTFPVVAKENKMTSTLAAEPKETEPVKTLQSPKLLDPPQPSSFAVTITRALAAQEDKGYPYDTFRIEEIDGKAEKFEPGIGNFDAGLRSRWKIILLDKPDKRLASVDLQLPSDGAGQSIQIELPARLPVIEVKNMHPQTDFDLVVVSTDPPRKGSTQIVPIPVFPGSPQKLYPRSLSPDDATIKQQKAFPTNGQCLRFPVLGAGSWSVTYTGGQLPALRIDPSTAFKSGLVEQYSVAEPLSGRYSLVVPMTPFPVGNDCSTTMHKPEEIEGAPPEVDYFDERVYLETNVGAKAFRQNIKSVAPSLDLPHYLSIVMEIDLKRKDAAGNMYLLLFYPHAAFTQYSGELNYRGPTHGNGVGLSFNYKYIFEGSIKQKDINKWYENEYKRVLSSFEANKRNFPQKTSDLEKLFEATFAAWVSHYSSIIKGEQSPIAKMAYGLNFATWEPKPTNGTFYIDIEDAAPEGHRVTKVAHLIDKKAFCEGHASDNDSLGQVNSVFIKPATKSAGPLLKSAQ